MRVFIKSLTLFIIFSSFSISWADCPHCYTVAKIELTLRKNGEIKKGYIPIHDGALTYGSPYRHKPIPKENLTNRLTNHAQGISIDFAENYYYVDKIGFLVAEEEVQKIQKKSVEKIIFIEWVEQFSGAIAFDTIPLKNIKKLQKHTIYHVERVSESCHDNIFVNLNPDISEKELKLFIKYLTEYNGYRNDMGLIYKLFNNEQSYRTNFPNNLIDAFQTTISNLEKKVEAVSSPEIKMKDLFNEIRVFEEKKIKLCNVLIDYLEINKIIPEIPKLIEIESQKDYYYKNTFNIIEDDIIRQQKNHIRRYLDLFEQFFLKKNAHLLQEAFNRSDIIPLTRSWD
ncbi:MAG: hypothetical protein HN692_08030 [Candidatus Cloacimonetes bacterium]|nr:hypothetical protein [Candidatus Cloacimonadota bacterium]